MPIGLSLVQITQKLPPLQNQTSERINTVGTVQVISQYSSYYTGAVQYTAPDGDYFAKITTTGCNLNSVSRTITLAEGQSLAGYAAFDAGDYMPYNDYADLYIEIYGQNWELFYSDIATVGNYGETGWIYWEFVAPEAGVYTLYYGAENVRDCGVNSWALLDLVSCFDSDDDGLDRKSVV